MSLPPSLRLLTIRPSHYCEKARWGLERAGLRFVEDAHPPLLHWRASAAAAWQRTVPILETPQGPIAQSHSILAYADRAMPEPLRLYPVEHDRRSEVEALERAFDDAVGPAIRRLAYFHLLQDLDVFVEVLTQGTDHPLEAMAFKAGRRFFAAMLRQGLRVDEGGARRSRERLEAAFEDVDARLRDGRRYLVGDRFTAADLTFAALTAPLLRPMEHGVPLVDVAARIPSYAAESNRFRATPAGAFVLRLYREERRRVVGEPS